MKDYRKAAAAIRLDACPVDAVDATGAGAAEAIDELLYQRALDMAEIVSLRRQIEALEEAGA